HPRHLPSFPTRRSSDLVYAVVGSEREGLDRLTADRAGQRTLIVFQANRFCPSTSRLPEHYADRIRKLDGVRDVVPMQVFMNNCRDRKSTRLNSSHVAIS